LDRLLQAGVVDHELDGVPAGGRVDLHVRRAATDALAVDDEPGRQRLAPQVERGLAAFVGRALRRVGSSRSFGLRGEGPVEVGGLVSGADPENTFHPRNPTTPRSTTPRRMSPMGAPDFAG